MIVEGCVQGKDPVWACVCVNNLMGLSLFAAHFCQSVWGRLRQTGDPSSACSGHLNDRPNSAIVSPSFIFFLLSFICVLGNLFALFERELAIYNTTIRGIEPRVEITVCHFSSSVVYREIFPKDCMVRSWKKENKNNLNSSLWNALFLLLLSLYDGSLYFSDVPLLPS